VVVPVNTGVVYEALVCPAIAVPPVETVYHRYCPALPPEALSMTAEEPHAEAPVVEGAAGMVLIVAMTEVLALSQNPLFRAT
jgi:hypothetical protein